jgi:drug/metabolite transporter (DMT)-like permease
MVALWWEVPAPPPPPAFWSAVVFTAVVATAIAFVVQTGAQRVIPPTHTAVVFASEPVFAAVFGMLWVGEVLPPGGWLGAALILAAILAVLIRPRKDAQNE